MPVKLKDISRNKNSPTQDEKPKTKLLKTPLQMGTICPGVAACFSMNGLLTG